MHHSVPMHETGTLPLIGAADAARRLGVSRSTIQRRARSGALPPAFVMTGPTGVPAGYLFQPSTIEDAEQAREATR